MITKEEIEKAGWKPMITDATKFTIDGKGTAYVLQKGEGLHRFNFQIWRAGGQAGEKQILRTVFRGQLSSILELEHIMHWTGIK